MYCKNIFENDNWSNVSYAARLDSISTGEDKKFQRGWNIFKLDL